MSNSGHARRSRATWPSILRIGATFAGLLAVTVTFAAWSSTKSVSAVKGSATAKSATSQLNSLYPETKGSFTSKDCAADKAAGTITDITSFGYGASPGTTDPIEALHLGYFSKLCLTVRIISANDQAALVSADQAQVTSQSSASNVIQYVELGDRVIGVATIGKVLPQAILLNKQYKNLKQLEGHNFGYYQTMSDVYIAMLIKAGIPKSKICNSGADSVHCVLLTNRNPELVTEDDVQGIATFDGSQNVQLNEDGLKGQYNQVTAGSLGLKGVTNVMYMSKQFVQQHATAAQNFLRADLKALEYCVVNQIACVDQVDDAAAAAGEASVYGYAQNEPQWKFQAGTVRYNGTKPLGTFDAQLWEPEYNEFKTYGYEANVLNGESGTDAEVHLPPIKDTFNNKLVDGIYNTKGQLVWP